MEEKKSYINGNFFVNIFFAFISFIYLFKNSIKLNNMHVTQKKKHARFFFWW